jgi:hypothetical protein
VNHNETYQTRAKMSSGKLERSIKGTAAEPSTYPTFAASNESKNPSDVAFSLAVTSHGRGATTGGRAKGKGEPVNCGVRGKLGDLEATAGGSLLPVICGAIGVPAN